MRHAAMTILLFAGEALAHPHHDVEELLSHLHVSPALLLLVAVLVGAWALLRSKR